MYRRFGDSGASIWYRSSPLVSGIGIQGGSQPPYLVSAVGTPGKTRIQELRQHTYIFGLYRYFGDQKFKDIWNELNIQ